MKRQNNNKYDVCMMCYLLLQRKNFRSLHMFRDRMMCCRNDERFTVRSSGLGSDSGSCSSRYGGVSVFNSKKRRQRNSANDTKPTCCSDFCMHRCSLPHVPEEGALGGNTKCRSATQSSLVRERTRSCLASWMMKR